MPVKTKKKAPPASPSVFISYAWVDEVSALAIDQWLRNHGARVLIDRRDFVAGNDIEEEIVRCISKAGKVVCIYSKNSANRPYPELERRIAAALEKQPMARKTPRRRLIYFCIDDTPLPTEALPRLAIKASGKDFNTPCQELWRAIRGRAAAPKQLDLSEFEDTPPWNKTLDDVKWLADTLGLKASLKPDRLADWVQEMRSDLSQATRDSLDVAIKRVRFQLNEHIDKCGCAIDGAEGAYNEFIQTRQAAERTGRDKDGLGRIIGSLTSLSVSAERNNEAEKMRRLRRALLELDLHEEKPQWETMKQMLHSIFAVLSNKNDG